MKARGTDSPESVAQWGGSKLIPHGFHAFVERHSYWLVLLLVVGTALPFVFVIDAPIHGDVGLYRYVGENLANGLMPYRDRELEYPPYAIPIFLLPSLINREPDAYKVAFGILVLLMDSTMKALLFIAGFGRRKGVEGFAPLLMYSAAVLFIQYFYLQRYDIFPAVLTLAALLCFAKNWFGWSGALLSIAAGLKLYPALLGPMLWVLAIRRHEGKRFFAGATLALVPLAILALFLPWWRFMAFHNSRGIQAESLYAAVLWLGQFFGLEGVEWTFVRFWTEITGPLAEAIVPWAKLLMLSTTLGSVGFAAWAANRLPSLDLARLARLALIPLVPFVAFNIVLSPQYLVWLLPLAALGLLEASKWPMVMIALATAVIPLIYPGRHYGSGLNFFETLVLLFRDLGLVIVWLALLKEFWRLANNQMPSVQSDGRL